MYGPKRKLVNRLTKAVVNVFHQGVHGAVHLSPRDLPTRRSSTRSPTRATGRGRTRRRRCRQGDNRPGDNGHRGAVPTGGPGPPRPARGRVSSGQRPVGSGNAELRALVGLRRAARAGTGARSGRRPDGEPAAPPDRPGVPDEPSRARTPRLVRLHRRGASRADGARPPQPTRRVRGRLRRRLRATGPLPGRCRRSSGPHWSDHRGRPPHRCGRVEAGTEQRAALLVVNPTTCGHLADAGTADLVAVVAAEAERLGSHGSTVVDRRDVLTVVAGGESQTWIAAAVGPPGSRWEYA